MNIDNAIAELSKISDERIAIGFITKGRVENHMRVKFSDLRRVLLAMKEPVQKAEPSHCKQRRTVEEIQLAIEDYGRSYVRSFEQEFNTKELAQCISALIYG
jgi:hypothetical protein